jgi:hypothetical protein
VLRVEAVEVNVEGVGGIGIEEEVIGEERGGEVIVDVNTAADIGVAVIMVEQGAGAGAAVVGAVLSV